ncbi:MAG: hypothetical protein QM762_12645 [Chryseolinea sp.]
MGRVIALTAKVIDGQTLSTPRVVYLQEDAIQISMPTKASRLTKVVETLGNRTKTYFVYEKSMQIEAQRNPASTDVLVKQQIALAITAAGTAQGNGVALTKYFNEITTIGAAATEAVVLPAATVGKVVVVLNNDASGDAAKVFPAVGEFINAQLVNTVLSIAAGDRVHFVCVDTAGKWITATDRGK